MIPFYTFLAYLVRIPAEIKGMKFGSNSFIGPGYDFLFAPMKGINVGDNVTIGQRAWLQTVPPATISIGDRTQIGRNVTISSMKKISIGKECLLSYNVSVFDHDHEYKNADISPIFSGVTKPQPTKIDDYCFIGAHSFILAGVQLGKHCVVAANSVVTKSFPAYSMVGGSPARFIKKLK